MKNSSITYGLIAITILFNCNIIALAADWWEGGNFYQIYPRSFKDSDGDGIGDLNGVASKLEYLKDIGITGVWLSPIFQSPMVDFGYDISDYRAIQAEYGSMEDFDRLLEKCHELGIKLILDFVPNHTSDEHEWFQKSVDRDPYYENFFIWHDGYLNETTGERTPPSNWVNAYHFGAWEWNDKRQQYYLHQFLPQQIDLNYREPHVVEAMKDVLRFWLDKGVDGFRIDAVPYLFEIEKDNNGGYRDEPKKADCSNSNEFCDLIHMYTQNLDETFDMVYEWRALLDDYKKEHGGDTRIIMIEAYTSLENSIRLYGNGIKNGSQIPFNFEFLNKLNRNSSAIDFKRVIDSWLELMPKDVHANWVLGNHDNKRTASRFGPERADLLNILLQTLPELALTDVYLSWEDTVDPQACGTNELIFDSVSRDPARTPFQWDDTKNGGFSDGNKTWLPLAPNYKSFNVQTQSNPNERSHLNIFKKLTSLRHSTSNTLLNGDFNSTTIGKDILLYIRELPNEHPLIVVLNFGGGNEKQIVNVLNEYPNIPATLKVITTSVQSEYSEGDIVQSNSVIAYPNVGTLFVGM